MRLGFRIGLCVDPISPGRVHDVALELRRRLVVRDLHQVFGGDLEGTGVGRLDADCTKQINFLSVSVTRNRFDLTPV